jgi:hypothetical protein
MVEASVERREAQAQVPLVVMGVVACALALRLVHLSSAVTSPLTFQLGPDEEYYFRFAKAVAAGVGQNRPEFTFMDPLYGYLLGAIFKLAGPNVFAVFALQCLLDAATTLGIVQIGRQLGRPRAGTFGALCYALAATAIMFSCSLLKEVWVASFMVWWVVIALKLRETRLLWPWALFGAYCALGIALRSTLVLMALVSMALALRGAGRAPKAACFVLGLFVFLLPWSLRNLEAGAGLSPLPHNGGIVLDQAYNPSNAESAIWIPPFVNYLNPSEIWRGYAAEAARRAGHPLSVREVDAYWRSQALSFMSSHPGAVLADMGRKARKFFASTEIPINRSLQEEGMFSSVIAILPAPAPFLLAMGLVGLVMLGRSDSRAGLVAVPLALAFFTVVMFWAEDRFRFHALPVLAFGAGIWIELMLQRIRARQLRPALTPLAAALLICAGSYALGATVPAPPLHWDQIVWGYIKMGRPRDAQAIADHVASEQPNNAAIAEAQGYLAVLRHDYAAAAAAYRHAVELRPRSDQAHFNLARSLAELGKRQEALTEAKTAAELKPDPDYSALVDQLKSSP